MPLNVFLLDMQANGLEIFGSPAPNTPVTLQYLNDRLTELERAARKANARIAGGNTLIVAPEGFFGVALCPFGSRWAHVKQRLRALSNNYPGFLFVAGTAKRTRGRGVRSCCRVVLNGNKIRNIYKVVAAGPADVCPGRPRWDQSIRRNPPVGANGDRRTKTGCFAWGGMDCGVEICNDARRKVLKNERHPNNDLELIVWVTRALYLDLAGLGNDPVMLNNFPLSNNGFLVQCGSGDGNQDSYPVVGARGNFGVNPPPGDERLGVYQRAVNNLNSIAPTGWSKLHHPLGARRFTSKVVYWLNL